MSAQGTWNLVMKTPVGDKKISFAFAVDGTALTGTMIDDGKTTDIVKGTVEGDTLKWGAKVSKPMPMTLQFSGTIAGDTVSGGAKSPFGTAQFTGKKA